MACRLRGQLAEIEAIARIRLERVRDGVPAADAEYAAGDRAAVREGLGAAIDAIESGEASRPRSLSPAAARQARRAARAGVGLDTLLRRHASTDRVLTEFILAGAEGLSSDTLLRVLSEHDLRADLVMGAVAAEYEEELELLRRSPAARLAERVERLLVGDGGARPDDVDYEFDGWHIGVIVLGSDPEATVRSLAYSLDRTPLTLSRGEETAWAWLGGRRPLNLTRLEPSLAATVPDGMSVAIGEPRRDLEGWRLTHWEAQAALRVMVHRGSSKLTRGSNVALLAAMLRDPTLARSLIETYLHPVSDPDLGMPLCKTLRTYIATGFNAASTAAILSLDRSTVQRHLRKAEDRLGRQLHTCFAELKVALELGEQGRGSESAAPRTVAPPAPRRLT